MKDEYSCGAVVFTRTDAGVRYVIIRSLEGVAGFPKGHMEAGETEEMTALREIREEVGLTPRLIPGFRAEHSYPLPSKPGVTKHVVYFLAEYENQKIVPQEEELTDARLLPFDEAMASFRFEINRQILKKAKEYLESGVRREE